MADSLNSDKVWQFVSTEQITAELGGTSLRGKEVDSAVSAVQSERVQWVYERLLQELGRRSLELNAEETSLKERLDKISSEQEIIEIALKQHPESKKQLKLLRGEQLAQAGYNDRFLLKLGQEKPFELQLLYQTKTTLQGENYRVPSLWHWYLEHEKEITNYYSDVPNLENGMLFSKTAMGFDRNYLNLGSVKANDFEPPASEKEAIDWLQSKSGYVISVNRPIDFFKELLNVRMFGPKSAVALLCLADYQKLHK